MAKVISSKTACPYWSPGCEQICSLTMGGLYIPLPEHISLFCRTTGWRQCSQYLRGCESLPWLNWERRLAQHKGRRRHYRSIRRHGLTLALATSAYRWEQKAQTLDFSQGGMRIVTPTPLPNTRRLNFAFGDDFPLPSFSGVGEIRWQRSTDRQRAYQYGLCFISKILHN